MRRVLLLLLLAAPALAQQPEIPPPPPVISDGERYVAWQAYCPYEGGVRACTIYVMFHRECVCETCVPRHSCAAADVNDDGTVDAADWIACSALEGKAAEACAALVQVYWGQSCQGSATSSPPSGQHSASTQE